MRAQKPSYLTAVTWPLIFVLFWLAGGVTFGMLSYHRLQSADAPRKVQGTDLQPQVMLITNEQHVTANVQVAYYSGGYTSNIGVLTLKGGHPGTFPVGIRYISITFSGARPGTTLQYAFLLNHDAESNTSGLPEPNSRGLPQNPVSVGSPGVNFTYAGNCTLPENTLFTQVMFSGVPVSSDGTADTQIAGKVMNPHPYLATGSTDIVNVMEFLPTAFAMVTASASSGCKWLFPNSPYLGGVRWYSPATLAGSVNIGSLQSDYTVQSATPTLEDLSTLYWEFSGPTAINYILIDNSVASQASDNLFLAGAFVAVAAGFAIEFLKSCVELRTEIRDVREQRERLKERAEEKMEREKEKVILSQLFSAKRKVQPDFITVLQVVSLTTLTRWLASMFKRNR